MVIAIRVARMNERHVIHVLGHAGKNVADPRAALAVTGEFERRLHYRANLCGEKARVLVKALELLAISLIQFWLVLPRIDMAGPAVHEEPDNALHFGQKMALFRRQRV